MNDTGDLSHAAMRLRQDETLRDSVRGSRLFDRLKNGLKRVTIDGTEFFVAEGDTLLDEDQLGIYALSRERLDEARRAADLAGLGTAALTEARTIRGLIAITQNGKIVRWQPGLVLSYRIIKDTFSTTEYELVANCMSKATGEWENTCGIKFEYRQDLDNINTIDGAGALFCVRKIDAGGAFIASAFFPNDPKSRRRVLIDPSFFAGDLPFDRVGVLRHELGHVLGFRHEHIHRNAPPACPDEPDFDAQSMTAYDPHSVMHYFCGEVGSRDLRITDLDREGAQQVYGPSLALVSIVAE